MKTKLLISALAIVSALTMNAEGRRVTFTADVYSAIKGAKLSLTATLSRKIRSLLGQTPLEFIKTIKFKHAYRLLQEHKCTVVEAMEAIGYSDHNTFAQTFKEIFGKLPSKV